MIGYSDKAIRPLILIISRMSGHVKTFKVKDGDRDKNNTLMSFHRDDEKLCFEWNVLAVYDDRYIKAKIKTWR